jgi:hypothetical protein
MEKLKDALRPAIDLLPAGLRGFLDAGGWWVVAGGAVLALLLLIAAMTRRGLRRLKQGRPRLEDADRDYREDLTALVPAHLPPAKRRLTLYHLPVRLRLVVVAPAGTEQTVDSATVGQLLDRAVPGLEAIALDDQARIRIWPPQLSQQGFAHTFQRRVPLPGAEGEPSRWALVGGPVQLGRQTILLGLALFTRQPTTLRQVTLEPHQWLDALRIKA